MKGNCADRYKWFKFEAFECSCCRGNKTSPELIRMLDRARELAGIPFYVNSGYRCPKHNREEGGKSTSSHLKGLAADIRCNDSSSRFLIIESLLKVGFTRIGQGSNFIHCDIDVDKVGDVIWLY